LASFEILRPQLEKIIATSDVKNVESEVTSVKSACCGFNLSLSKATAQTDQGEPVATP
jgi:hypothetical protein